MSDVVVTRACEHAGIYYQAGDGVVNHDAGHLLVRLGFATYASDDDTPPLASAEEAPPSGNRRAPSSNHKEN